jgi:two-component system, NtrC family, response regulator AtoC
MKILVIDDDDEILNTLSTFFTNEGHEVKTTSSGQDGKRLAIVDRPDLVLLDIRLPDQDGIEILKELKQADKDLVIVMITGYKDAEKVVSAFRLGAFDCLLKPFNYEYLRNNILARVPRRMR